MIKVQVEILGLSSSPSAGGAYALLLRESFGTRRLPIIIGGFEAQAIALELEGIKPPRPLTHDLLKQFVDHLSVSITEVIIDELRDNTFFAKIILEVASLQNAIDARPSDAIALAVRTNSPIYVAEKVMAIASFEPTGEENEDYTQSAKKGKPESAPRPQAETEVASLHDKLREAIDKEDYERAANLRDKINKLKGQSPSN
ncbi:MAG: bifunctional nuclease family protein [Bacteroidetes bacterium]|nr:bifunctional nuclease family protein [Bacteroidota bacterium]MBU1680895.1 bifunctional nuclease family protein [Bacteroidota bacterium]MBU2507681.1 bifunctional nuclease family protein [Bacteroidota bacterium]